MPTPSKDSRPSAGRTAKFEAPVPPLNVPVVRSRITLVVLRGSISSYTLPPLVPPPFSSVNTIVPHGVRLAASQKIVPLTMVCTDPVAMLIRWSPGSALDLFIAGDQPFGVLVVRPPSQHVDDGRPDPAG